MALPTDTQLEFVRDEALPPGTLTDLTRYGEHVTAAGQDARIVGVDGRAPAAPRVFYAFIDDMDFFGYNNCAPSQVTPA